jgi:putative tryptophan/tyrosine transport system substrate-binding protein
MQRREFITGLGSAAAWPSAARGQQAGRVRTIGFVGGNASTWTPWTAAFAERLRVLGWIEGRTVTIDYRWTEGRPERIVEIAAELVRRKVDVIVTNQQSAAALRDATSVIPIVFVFAIDPVGSELVASLGRPGGNITGLSLQTAETAVKRLQLLRELVPRLRRLAIIAHVEDRGALLETAQIEAAARTLGVETATPEIRRADDIAPAFAALDADAIYLVSTALVGANITRIMTFALTARLPTCCNARIYVQAGALISYGANLAAQFPRAAELVDKILRGTKPADIPVEQPTRFELVINLTTAKALGLTIPETLLATADEVIQ